MTKYLSLIIKGTPTTATDECRRRGLEGAVAVSQATHGETIIKIKGSRANLDKVFNWFIEPMEAPYPVGTLLHYNEVEL
jgi:hypothetical protein